MPMALPPTRDELAAELKVFIPKVGRWRHDPSCSLCGVVFSYLRGRHHCRFCGNSVCGKHSRNRAVVPSSMSTEKQRVCDLCYPQCQYGLPLQRRRGVTTAETGHSGGNFTMLDVTDSDDPRLPTERGRAHTAFPRRSRSRSPPSRRRDSNDSSSFAQRWKDKQAAREREQRDDSIDSDRRDRRRRGISEPPERHMRKVPASRKKLPLSPPPSPPSPLSPMTRQSISHGVFQMSPKKPMMKQFDSPKKNKSKTLSIRKHSMPPPPVVNKPLHFPSNKSLDASFTDSEFLASYASYRNTQEQDEIAMQYLSSYIKSNSNVQETNHVTVSHSNAGPVLGMSTVVEMKPASPQELQLASLTPPQSEAMLPNVAKTKSQNRRLSISSFCTVSVSDNDEDEEKPSSPVEWRTSDIDEEADIKSVLSHSASSAAPLTVEVNDSSSTRKPTSSGLSPSKSRTSVRFASSVTFAADTKPCEPEIPDEGLDLMRDIMDLEKQIHDYQCELRKLMDEWKRLKHIATVLRSDAQESRDKVMQYQRARAFVRRAIRVGTKCLAEKEYEAAALELSRAAAIERTNPKVWYLLAESRMKLNQLKEAEEACRVSIELQHSAVGVALLGRIFHALGRHDDAIKCYLTALGR